MNYNLEYNKKTLVYLALRDHDGCKDAAARALGVSKRSLYNWVHEWGWSEVFIIPYNYKTKKKGRKNETTSNYPNDADYLPPCFSFTGDRVIHVEERNSTKIERADDSSLLPRG